MFVHSGIRGAIRAAQAHGMPISGDIKADLLKFFSSFVGNDVERLIFPAFNYDYGKTRRFDVDSDPVQVGSLPEYVRINQGFIRSEIPFFSFLSAVNLNLGTSNIINPFGENSGFQKLINLDATIMFAGAALSNITFIHFVEEMTGKPLYRYEKNFPGQIIRNGQTRNCVLKMHVRPLGVHMDYDWPRLAEELLAAEVIKITEQSSDIMLIGARDLYEFWGNKISSNPLYLLDGPSLSHFADATCNGTRRVLIEEYEND